MLCRHCHRCPGNRPRGLCWGCYRDRSIRARYPWKYHHCSSRGVEDFNGRAAMPRRPTVTAPGSLRKMAVLARRAGKRQSLHHAADTGLRDEGGADWGGSAESRDNERRYLAAEAAREERRAWDVCC